MILGYTKKSFFNAVLHSNADPSLKWYAKTMIDILNHQLKKQKVRRAAIYEYQNRPLMVKICRFFSLQKRYACFCSCTVLRYYNAKSSWIIAQAGA